MPDRLIFMAMPPPDVLGAMRAVLVRNGLKTKLGGRLFAEENWHQSLSDRYDDEPLVRERLLRAGDKVLAPMFPLVLNRMRGQANTEPVHWEFKTAGTPKGLGVLLGAIRVALSQEGFGPGPGHTPHVTISYNAGEPLPPTEMEPIEWTIDQFMLVVGRGRPYRYEVIKAWPLQPVAADAVADQMSLF